jgi:hypothetical protein
VPHDWIGIGRVDARALMIVLARDKAEFARVSRGRLPEWGAGATLGGGRLVIIRLDAGDPFQTLAHELAHVALHRVLVQRVPLWFDEGYAVVAAREYGRFDALRLNVAVATGRVPGFNALDAELRGGDAEAEEAYALAGSAVTELGRKSRNSDLGEMITLLRAGVPFDEAVDRGTGMSVDRFEEEWQRSVRSHYNLVVWLATGGMWLVVTVILAVAAAGRKRREAPRRAALDEGWPEPPEDDETITIQAVGPPST